MKKSQKIIEKDKKYFAEAGRVPYYPFVVDHAKGSRITDVDARSILTSCLQPLP